MGEKYTTAVEPEFPKVYTYTAGYATRQTTSEIVIQLNKITQALQGINESLMRIAPYFEERTINAENKTEFEGAE